MRKILIIGAASAIAEATARIWAQSGDHLFLVARNQDKLESIAADLRVRGCPKVETYTMDANDFNIHTRMLDAAEQALDGLDTVLIAHGSLSDQVSCQQSVEKTLLENNTNALSAIALLTHIANRFELRKDGVILVISSVAGDRGRQSNYIYGSSKAMLTTFCSGLRQRLYKSGVSVVTIKPGFVDTPMTTEFKKGALWATPEKIAKYIVDAANKQKNIVYAPFFWQFIMLIIQHIPEAIFKRLKL
jgi:short-subunit dehydrogenase